MGRFSRESACYVDCVHLTEAGQQGALGVAALRGQGAPPGIVSTAFSTIEIAVALRLTVICVDIAAAPKSTQVYTPRTVFQDSCGAEI